MDIILGVYMKKVLTSLVCGLILASTASADFARVEMGGGAWMQAPNGDLSYTAGLTSGSDKSAENEEVTPYVWLLIKHPIPLVPNLRVEYVALANEGTAIGTFEDFTASGGKTSLDMTQFDIIPYYNLLDNTAWITLDVGIDLKIINLDYQAEGVTIGALSDTSYSEVSSVVVPLGYVRARVQIPTTNIGLESDVKYISNGSSTVYDARAKVDYTFDITPLVQPALEIGYRVQKIDIDEEDVSGKMDLEFAGIYAGLMLRF